MMESRTYAIGILSILFSTWETELNRGLSAYCYKRAVFFSKP